MIKYHKIDSIYKRDEHGNFMAEVARPEFDYLCGNAWRFTEKVDGTNVRVGWNGTAVEFGGRTDNAQMPVFLMRKLQEMFSVAKLAACFPESAGADIVLFGEGYGARIQKGGGNYIPDDQSFILFDVWYNGLWLQWADVEDIGTKLAVQIAPTLGIGTLTDAVNMVRDGFGSWIGTCQAEGLVLRPVVELADRRGHRIITKIKHKDFAKKGKP